MPGSMHTWQRDRLEAPAARVIALCLQPLVTHNRALAALTAVGRDSPPLLASRCAAAGCDPRSHAMYNAPSRLKAAERLLLPSPLLLPPPPPAGAALMASSRCLSLLTQAMAGQGTPLVSVVTDYGEHASTCGYCGTRKSGGAKGRRAGELQRGIMLAGRPCCQAAASLLQPLPRAIVGQPSHRSLCA